MKKSPVSSPPYPHFNEDECKSCGRCLASCPQGCLEHSDQLNTRGVFAVRYKGRGCVGCNRCFYTCPEPYAIEIIKEKEHADESFNQGK